MNEAIAHAMQTALSGPINKAVVLPHPIFKLFAQNHEGHAAFVIKVSLSDDQVVLDGHGFSVKTVRGGHDNFLRLTAAAPGLPLVFLQLVELILERTAGARSQADAVHAVVDAIDEFRTFGGRIGNRLSENEVRGTFAELVVLCSLIAEGLKPSTALATWRGPFSLVGIGNHDFVFPDGSAIEVKSIRQGALEVQISSGNQLVPSGSGLDLLILPLEKATGGTNFRAYALGLQSQLFSQGQECKVLWSEALQALGLDLEDEWYDQYHFLQGTWRKFRVIPGFPHIPPQVIPFGVTRVKYSLSLAQLAPFEIPAGDLSSQRGGTGGN